MADADDGTEPIWTVQQLRDFTAPGHPEPVRRWALERLAKFDDEFVGFAAERLADPDEIIAQNAFRHARESFGPEHIDVLREFRRRDDIFESQRESALGVLAAVGDEEARADVLEQLGSSGDAFAAWADHRPDDFTEALEQHLGDQPIPPHPGLLSVYVPEASPAQAGAVLEALGRLDDAELRDQLAFEVLGRVGGALPASLPRMFGEEDYTDDDRPFADHIVRRIDDIDDRYEAIGSALESEDFSQLAELLLATIDDLVAEPMPAGPLPPVEWATGCVDALRTEPKLLKDEQFRTYFVFGLFLGVEAVVGSEAYLEEGDQPNIADILEVLPHCLGAQLERLCDRIAARWQQLDEQPRSEAGELIDERIDEWSKTNPPMAVLLISVGLVDLEGYDATRWIDALADLADREFESEELLEDLLVDEPSVLRERAGDFLLSDGPLRRAALEALDAQNSRWAADVYLQHWEQLLDHPDSPNLFNHIKTLGDPRLLEPLIELWQPGEPTVAAAAVRLARLAGRVDELDDELLGDAARRERRFEETIDKMSKLDPATASLSEMVDAFGDTLELPLRCNSCERVYTYEIDQVFLDIEQDGPPDPKSFEEELLSRRLVPNRIIRCKNCRAVDDYEFTEQARTTLLPHLMKLTSTDLTGIREQDLKLVPTTLRLWDGSKFSRPSQALEHLEEVARQRPDDAKVWRRLGNFCERFSEPERAESAWRRAVETDEAEVEARASLADHLWDSDSGEVPQLVIEALEAMPDGDISPDMRWGLAMELVEMLEAIVEAGVSLGMRASRTRRGGPGMVADIGHADLSRITNWEGLATLFAEDAFNAVQFTDELPSEPTAMERFIEHGPATPSRAPSGAKTPVSGPDPGGGSRLGGPGQTYVKSEEEKVGRNDPCPCGSGRKYKKCCLRK